MCSRVVKRSRENTVDSAMRDLEQIRERDDEGEGRPLALVGLLMVVTITLVFAMGSLVGWTSEEEELADDPLARLDDAAGLMAADVEPQDEEEREVPDIDRASLSFPSALGPVDDRPELAAAVAAAQAELEHPDPLSHLPPLNEPAEERIARALPGAVPAAVAAGPGSRTLARAAAHDPLVASSLPAPSPEAAAPAGHDGEYTVQVISVADADAAEAFAAGLRQRGHRAFVVAADVEDRGTMHRVRVGPFETNREAQAYRRSFEQTERMNTLVVRRRE